MWVIDLHHDYEWTNQHSQSMVPRFTLGLTFQADPNLTGRLNVYGDDYEFRHASIELDVDSKEEAEQFYRTRMHAIITSLELVLSIAYQQPFHLRRLPGSTDIITSYGLADDGKHQPVHITPQNIYTKLDYNFIKLALGSHYPGLEDYEYYFLSGIDTTLDYDYRWLSHYKIYEKRYGKPGKVTLVKEPKWQNFLEKYRPDLAPFLAKEQSLAGLMEQLRASAAHSIVGLNPRDANAVLRDTFPALEKMSKDIINNHPSNKNGIKFT